MGENRGPDDWSDGRTLLGDYVVQRRLGAGGMGAVYLVRSKTTGQTFALKRILPKCLQDAKRRRLFLRELQTWIDLPEHPNLAGCRFFRSIDGQIAIFAEYVDGGSLAEWIRAGRLADLPAALDVAIQVCRGLDLAHRWGVVHRDVKPLNILMTADSVAKVTDFGLARAADAGEGADEPGSITVTSPYGTRGYAAPEQIVRGAAIDHRADIFAFGATLWEMLGGRVEWRAQGPAAARQVAGEVLRDGRGPGVPPELGELILRCLAPDPRDRWASMTQLAEALAGIHLRHAGRAYSRPCPSLPARPRPQAGRSLSSALSRVDLPEPVEQLRRALRAAGRDPAQAGALLDAQGSTRKGQLVAEMATLDAAMEIYRRLPPADRDTAAPDLARLCLQKAYLHGEAGDEPGQWALIEQATAAVQDLPRAHPQGEGASLLAECRLVRARLLCYRGRNEEALADCDRAIDLYTRLAPGGMGLAECYIAKAHVLDGLGKRQVASALFVKSIEMLRRLRGGQDSRPLALLMSVACNDAALLLFLANKADEALPLIELALKACRSLPDARDSFVVSVQLVTCYLNKAPILTALGKGEEALDCHERAIVALTTYADAHGREEVAEVLAKVYGERGFILDAMGGHEQAVADAETASTILESLVRNEGRLDLAPGLARAWGNAAVALGHMGRFDPARELCDRAIGVLDALARRAESTDAVCALAICWKSKAAICLEAEDYAAVVGPASHAIKLCRRLVAQPGRQHMAEFLATSLVDRAVSQSWLDGRPPDVGACRRAVALYEELVNKYGRSDLVVLLGRAKTCLASGLFQTGDRQGAAAQAQQAVSLLQERLARSPCTAEQKLLAYARETAEAIAAAPAGLAEPPPPAPAEPGPAGGRAFQSKRFGYAFSLAEGGWRPHRGDSPAETDLFLEHPRLGMLLLAVLDWQMGRPPSYEELTELCAQHMEGARVTHTAFAPVADGKVQFIRFVVGSQVFLTGAMEYVPGKLLTINAMGAPGSGEIEGVFDQLLRTLRLAPGVLAQRAAAAEQDQRDPASIAGEFHAARGRLLSDLVFVIILGLLGAVGGAIAMFAIPPADRPALPDNRSVVFVAVFASFALGSFLYALWYGFTLARDESGSNAAVGCVIGLLMMSFGPIVTPALMLVNLGRMIVLAILLVFVRRSQADRVPAGPSA